MKILRNIIHINEELCNGCGQCILDCAEGAIRIENGKAKVIADMLCDGLGACLSGCPTGALSIEKREADAYDEQEVLTRLAKEGKTLQHNHTSGGCLGGMHHQFPMAGHTGMAKNLTTFSPTKKSEHIPFVNTHWPVKLRLMSAEAPFLQGANILLAADCAGFASATFHSQLREDHVLLTACPKFEDAASIREKLSAIVTLAKPKSITVARMEVPCCTGLITLCKEVAQSVPVRSIVITRQGELTIEE